MSNIGPSKEAWALDLILAYVNDLHALAFPNTHAGDDMVEDMRALLQGRMTQWEYAENHPYVRREKDT